jgi:hypothetical protein
MVIQREPGVVDIIATNQIPDLREKIGFEILKSQSGIDNTFGVVGALAVKNTGNLVRLRDFEISVVATVIEDSVGFMEFAEHGPSYCKVLDSGYTPVARLQAVPRIYSPISTRTKS